ncbi:hypothetical protein MKX01_027744 [Papaver californicum]|nr:hypothetical protein MKX01_027744 [Papaver californicum]
MAKASLCNRYIRLLLSPTGASKILITKNLSISTTKSDMINFFKRAGEIDDVHFSRYFRGTCHIEFASEEGAKKAAEMKGKYFMDRPFVLGFARETIYVARF